jgi:hypothetical protein
MPASFFANIADADLDWKDSFGHEAIDGRFSKNVTLWRRWSRLGFRPERIKSMDWQADWSRPMHRVLNDPHTAKLGAERLLLIGFIDAGIDHRRKSSHKARFNIKMPIEP